MGSFSIWHWVIVLVIVLLIFGTKKLRNVGNDLGGAVKGFKDGMKSDEKDFVMRRFLAGELNILVSTTVVEVGVDVPPHQIAVRIPTL